MKLPVFYLFIAFFPFGSVVETWSAELNKEQVYAAYKDGEFEIVKENLNHFLSEESSPSRSDKIFAYKYLGIVYAANEMTRTKAESYMIQLLRLVPDQKVLDPYVSERIQNMFDKVRQRYIAEQKYASKTDEYGVPVEKKAVSPKSTEQLDSGKKSSSKTGLWVAGGVAVAATAGVVSWLILSENEGESTDVENMKIPSQF